MIEIKYPFLFFLCHIFNPILGLSFVILFISLLVTATSIGLGGIIVQSLFVSLGMFFYGYNQPYFKTYSSAVSYLERRNFSYLEISQRSVRYGIRAAKFYIKLIKPKQ